MRMLKLFSSIDACTATLLLAIVALGGCDNPTSGIDFSSQGDTGNISLSPPVSINQSRMIDRTQLEVQVKVNNQPVSMTAQNGQWTGQITIQPSAFTVLSITWEHGDLPIAKHVRDIGRVTGNTDVVISNDAYDFDALDLDFDGDLLNNFAELECGTDPADDQNPGGGESYASSHACLNRYDATIPMLSEFDRDSDGLFDGSDNCPGTSNPFQTDTDGDGLGDECDPVNDIDSEGGGTDGGTRETQLPPTFIGPDIPDMTFLREVAIEDTDYSALFIDPNGDPLELYFAGDNKPPGLGIFYERGFAGTPRLEGTYPGLFIYAEDPTDKRVHSNVFTITVLRGDAPIWLPPVFDGPDIPDMTFYQNVEVEPLSFSGRFSDPNEGGSEPGGAMGGNWPPGIYYRGGRLIGSPVLEGVYSGLTLYAENVAGQRVDSNLFTITVLRGDAPEQLPPTFIGPDIPTLTFPVGVEIETIDFRDYFVEPNGEVMNSGTIYGNWPPGLNDDPWPYLRGTPTLEGTYSGLSVSVRDPAELEATTNQFTIIIE